MPAAGGQYALQRLQFVAQRFLGSEIAFATRYGGVGR